MKFSHLHIHNEYSLLDGFGTAEAYAERAKKLGFKYLALTNHGNIDGALQWQEACIKNDIIPILGCEMYIVKDVAIKERGYSHIILLVKNKEGFRNLNRLLTYANLEGFYYKPRIDYKVLEKYLKGLVVLSGCMASLILNDKKAFLKIAKKAENVYLEMMPHDIENQRKLNKEIIKINKKYSYPIVATNDCHYIKSSDRSTQELLLAIQTKAAWDDKNRFKLGIDGLYLKTVKEMKKAFIKQGFFKASDVKEIEAILANTESVVKLCGDFRIEKKKPALPYIEDKKTTNKQEMKEIQLLCKKGYKEIFNGKLNEDKKYYARFKKEFDLIKSKEFGRYYLIVKDFLRYCDKVDIMYGPGRGSVAGSLIAYLMGITAVDPIKHSLLFERFIAEDRIDYPDIDIDIEHNRREDARRYLENKYGANRVVGITTALRLKPRGAIKDSARVFGVSDKEVNDLSRALNYIFFKQAKESFKVIDEALKSHRVNEKMNEVKMFFKYHPHIIKEARKLEGQVRAYGQHPAGLVLSPVDLTKSSRGHIVKRKNNLLLNWDMDEAEKLGFLKLDVLALDTLTILGDTKRLIKKNKGEDINFKRININDKKLFKLINTEKTKGLFQINTNFSTKICKEVKIEKFENLSAAISLARPGPYESGMTEEYIRRKNGGRWKGKSKVYEGLTKDTYGVIVYQEQVMAAVRKLAGLTYADADKIRKVIGKKRDRKEFAPFKKAFMVGSLKKKTLNKKEGEEFWEMLLKHSRYSFNRAHAVSYAVLAMWTAYCKHYYPEEFICSALTYIEEKEQKDGLLNEARSNGLNVVLPKIGISDSHKWVVKENNLYVPFIEIKGIGDKTAIKVVGESLKKRKRAKGFFNVKEEEKQPEAKTKVDQLLNTVGVYDPLIQPSEEVKKYFDFDIFGDFEKSYPNLMDMYDGDIMVVDEEDAFKAKIFSPKVIKKYSYRNLSVIKCEKCNLRIECRQPVPCSKGKYNAAIICEAPGPEEDKYKNKKGYGKGLVGSSGNKLWEEFKKYKLKRKLFHVTNVNKCYPSLTGTPTKDQVVKCSGWLNQELKEIDCHLALACGNNALFYFTGQKSGIQKMSGEILWIESRSMWVVFCVHPAAVLHNKKENEELFKKGVKVFAKIFKKQR
jgi:DNA polymerase-3 subunit alpha